MNSALPALTIAIPTVNRLDLLKRALASALAQTVPVEVIVSDNGSSDGTDAYLASLQLPANVRRFRHTTTMPVQRHGTFIISNVRTEWVVFLTDDDNLEPEFAAGVVQLIEERPDVALVYTGCDLYFGDTAVPAKVGPRFESAADFFFRFMDGKRNICLCATAFRARDYRSIGQQPESCVIGDMYYWTRVLAAGGTVGCVVKRLSNYFFYWPGISTETNRTPVPLWTRESQQLAAIMCASILADGGTTYSPSDVERVRAKFLALTTSNQFAWNALRGAGKLELLCSLASVAGIVFGDVGAPVRAIGAILLPRVILERRVLAHGRRLSRAAGRS